MAARILVVDDVPTNRLLLSFLLEKAFYEVREAESGPEALEIARSWRPDLALLDVMMPGMDGFELCRRMKDDPDLAETPVVMVTTLDAVADRRAGIEAGADDFLTKPVEESALYARLRSLSRLRAMREELRLRDATSRELGAETVDLREVQPPAGGRAVVVGDEPTVQLVRREIERRMDLEVCGAASAREALDLVERLSPEAVVLDAAGFGGVSPEFCEALRRDVKTRATPVIALVPERNARAAAAALDAGANDVVTRPVDGAELCGRLRTQLRYKAHADLLRDSVCDGLRLAATDPLTGLRNRRYFDAHLRRLIEQARASGDALSILAFDIDRFKALNDANGHSAGDEALREFGRRLLDNTRSVDLVARTGGEEFLVAMPDAPLAAAQAAGERVRAAVEAPCFELGGLTVSVTVSVGVATLRFTDGAASLLERADAALYAAKAGGRNRVTLEAA